MICKWYVNDTYMICEWYVNDMWMICKWHVNDMKIICDWCVNDMWMMCKWYVNDIDMIWKWYANFMWHIYIYHIIISTCSIWFAYYNIYETYTWTWYVSMGWVGGFNMLQHLQTGMVDWWLEK